MSSILLGILPWVHIRFAVLEMPLFFAFLYRIYVKTKRSNYKYYIYYLIPVTILFIVFEIYNYTVWDTLNPAASEVNAGGKTFVVLPFQGLLGAFFDQEYGILLNFPMFIFLLTGIVLTLKKKLAGYSVLMLILSIPYLLLFTTFRLWSGGWCPPARFILVLLPLYSFYIAYALQLMNNVLSKLVFGLVTLYGFAYSLLSLKPVLVGFNSGTGRNHALAQIHRLLFNRHLTDYLPSVFSPQYWGLFVVWMGICVGVTLVLLISMKQNLFGPRGYVRRQ